MKEKEYITVKRLANIIKVYPTTLRYWLCHYSIQKYTKLKKVKNQNIQVFELNDKSIECLREYLFKKGQKYIKQLNKALYKIKINSEVSENDT